MKSFLISICFVLFAGHVCIGQLVQPDHYREPADPKPVNTESWKNLSAGTHSGFVSVNERFQRSAAPAPKQVSKTWATKAWRGERVHTQLLIYSSRPVGNVRLMVSDLQTSSGKRIPQNAAQASFVRYVMTDLPANEKSGCGIKNLDSALSADMIDHIKTFSIEPNTTRPVWLQVDVPADAAPGMYTGTLSIVSRGYKATHPFTIQVLDHILPPVKEWDFHLDLWQNPFSDARIYGVEPWSDKHFEVMKPNYTMLANAGQKVITATLIKDPWRSQTYDVYDGMIRWIKKTDGTWLYDFSVFDKWVSFMMGLGIDKQINCYSMIPWSLEFTWNDEKSGKDQVLKASPESEAYKAHWGNMLKEFAKHLRQKGWFDKTTIAMDERPEEAMKAAITVIRSADPDFKISLAGNYHRDIQNELYDYCIASGQQMDAQTVAERKAKGYVTTFYTACPEIYPNVFTSSAYAEATWLPWHALYRGFDGYLRWDYNNWNAHPMTDTRFGSWAAGDTYFVYPGARSSIRFERLREGIQDYTKASILMHQWRETNQTDKIRKLQQAIDLFTLKNLNGQNAHTAVDNAKAILNSF